MVSKRNFSVAKQRNKKIIKCKKQMFQLEVLIKNEIEITFAKLIKER